MLHIAIEFDSDDQPWAHPWKNALAAGIKSHGDSVAFIPASAIFEEASDVAVTWGLRGRRLELMQSTCSRGARHLVMERGFIGDRNKWTALTFDGLGGRGVAPAIDDFSRFEQFHGRLLRPWRLHTGKTALILGQVTGDAATRHVDLQDWSTRMVMTLRERDWNVLYRAHPQADPSQQAPSRAIVLKPGPLEAALSTCDLAVTFNSTSAVEAVLYGTPTYAEDPGSPAWEVTSHTLNPKEFDRHQWASGLAWKQWMLEEIADGTAWSLLRTAVRPVAACS